MATNVLTAVANFEVQLFSIARDLEVECVWDLIKALLVQQLALFLWLAR